VLTNLLSAKVAGIAVATVLGATTAAAAATGSLPAPAQTAVSKAASSVGVSVPDADSHGKSGSPHGKSASHKPVDRGPNANANFGQCTAFLAGSHGTTTTSSTLTGKDASTAFTDLIADLGNGSVATTTAACQKIVAAHQATHADDAADKTESTETTEAPEAPDAGKPATAGKPADAGKSGDHGKPSTPSGPEDTPTSGATAPADGASHGGAHH